MTQKQKNLIPKKYLALNYKKMTRCDPAPEMVIDLTGF